MNRDLKDRLKAIKTRTKPEKITAGDRMEPKATTEENYARVHWKVSLALFVGALPDDWEGTAEDIRVMWLKAGNPPPHSPRVWGAVIGAFISHGVLHKTGRYGRMSKASHSRETAIYARRKDGTAHAG